MITIIIGFIVGLVIGLTGAGGGLLVTPILILFFGLSPIVAVGTDLVYSTITKLFGSFQHLKQKTVDWYVVKWISFGSLPASLTCALLVHHLNINGFILNVMGVFYLFVALITIYRFFESKRFVIEKEKTRLTLVIFGVVIGCLVGLTSTGSGTLFMAFATLMYPISTATLVGTDIVQSLIITGITGLTYLSLGYVDFHLIWLLLIGSIPGIILGSKLTTLISGKYLKIFVVLILIISGLKLLNVL